MMAQSDTARAGAQERKSLHYLALGDSYTIGEGVNAAESFPAQLTARLCERDWNIGAAEIIARTGWTTDELEDALAADEPRGPYDLVTLLIGVNNQYRGRDPETYRVEFAKLLERAVSYAGNRPARVIVLSIPDWGVTPFGRDRVNVGREIDALNAINLAEAERRGARYMDITPISRAARDDPSLIAGDGLHPSGKMYARWVAVLLPMAIEAVESSA